MPVAAASAAISGVAGLISQESVHVKEAAHPYLITHRNLNLGLIGTTILLAQKRPGRRRPSLGYLLAGLGSLATMTYSAYLGGHMVYEHGVGVRPAGGVREDQAPELTRENAAEAIHLSRKHIRHEWQHATKHLEEGNVAPVLMHSGTSGEEGAAPE
jgi:hypothetical protein